MVKNRLCIVILLITIFFSCQRKVTEKENVVIKEIAEVFNDTTIAVFDSVLYRLSESASMRLTLEAPTHYKYKNGDDWYPKGILLTVYDAKTHRKRTTLKGDHAIHKNNKGKSLYKVYGNVEVNNIENKEVLTTDTLYWSAKTSEIYTNSSFIISTPDKHLTGESMRAQQDFSKYTIKRPRGVKYIKEKDKQ